MNIDGIYRAGTRNMNLENGDKIERFITYIETNMSIEKSRIIEIKALAAVQK